MDKTLFLCILQAWRGGFGIMATENLSNTSNRDKNLFFFKFKYVYPSFIKYFGNSKK